MRLFCAAALVLSIGLYVTWDRYVKGAAAEDTAAKLKEQKNKFSEEFDEIAKRFEAAETQAQKKGIKAEARELATLTAEKIRKIAEVDPKSDVAFDAASFAVTRLVTVGASGPDVDKLLAIITEHHLSNPKVKDLVLVAGAAGPAGEKFLQTAAEKAPDKVVRAISFYILGMSYSEQSDDAIDVKSNAALVAKAIENLERAKKESPKTEVDGERIEKAVDDEIKNLRTLALGSPVPDVKGTEIRDEKKESVAGYKGQVVLLDMWATWCGPCREMIPHERDMVKKFAGKPFKLISVSVDEKKSDLTKFLEKNPMPWVHWWDDGEENPLVKTLKVRAYPTLYLIDAKGVIRRKWVGAPDRADLDKAVEEVVKEATNSKG
jgi:thiol-disulfide isomerase/thioredoxin